MNPDGSGGQPLSTSNPNAHVISWSPDGQQIAYSLPPDAYPDYDVTESKIVIANADGTNETILTGGHWDRSPAWSPDGQTIAFVRTEAVYDVECECFFEGYGSIWTMNTDGTGLTDLTDTFYPREDDPNWSPDGQHIAYSSQGSGVYIMDADGSNQHYTGAKNGTRPVWSPDGSKIVFTNYYNNFGPFTMNPDGSGVTSVPGYYDDWQPLPVPDYPHPQSAPQLQVALVPAFRQCGTGGNPSNSKHAPSLALDSCNPPRPGSAVAAVGAASWGSAVLTTIPGDSDPTNGNQANFGIGTTFTDVQAIAGGDYDPNPSGADVTEVTRIRITDRSNGYGGLPATATEYDLRVPIDCTPTADPSTGSTCQVGTSANALFPGFIWEQRQTIVQAFRVRVDDAGNNGVPGDADDRIFATQGVFVP